MRNTESTTVSTGLISKIVSKCTQLLKYSGLKGYQAEKYWSDRHSQFQFNLQGVGNAALTHEVNEQMYLEAKNVFLSLCKQLEIDFTKAQILDVGCGTGFYAKIFQDNGGTNYQGIDITDRLFEELKQEFAGFKFQKLDVSSQKLNERFDLIIMIDVTQHITDPKKFYFAMQNIKSSLSENGIFIVTSWLDKNARQRFYEVSRDLEAYQKEFPDFVFSEPIQFRDKFIFSIRK